MKSSRRSILMIIGMLAAFALFACRVLELVATPQVELSPTPPVESSPTPPVDPSPTPPVEPSSTPFVPTASPTPETPVETEAVDLDSFRNALLEALTQTPPDYTALQSYMGGEFTIFEPFAAASYSPAGAIAEFGANLLPATAAISYDMSVDLHAIVTFPLPTDMDEYIYTTGWLDGGQMGVLLINSSPDGYVWSGVYLAHEKQQATEPIRIRFAPGETEATLWGSLAANSIDEYVLYALQGQSMTVAINSPGDNVLLEIYGLSDGIPLVRVAADATSWTGVLPASQDYSIKAVSSVPVPSYQLHVVIPPLATRDPNLYWVPLPEGVCQELEAMVAGELGVIDTWLETYAPFEDWLGGAYGRGCLISAGGTGADFANSNEVFLQLEEMLVNMGWTPDQQYGADGATGMSGGFRRDAGLMILSVNWRPSADADCPQDQPISACPLTPEQQIYDITLSVATQ